MIVNISTLPAGSPAIWKALADPTRREILDLLRECPRTTGELCGRFEISRFAVMKHLRVLEEAQLIAVRRRGRERWNHLNAVPLQAIVERWLEPFESAWASNLLRLKRTVEWKGKPVMPQNTLAPGQVHAVIIDQDIHIQAPPAQVFAALTGDITDWWGAPYLQASEAATGVVLEPRLGGHFIESWGEGEGAIWATVTNIKMNERIILTGSMAMPGAVFGVMRFDLIPRDGGTLLQFSHHAVGEVNEEQRVGYDLGWKDLLERRLKAWVEKGQRMGLGHEPPAG